MICSAKELSPDQKLAIESLLGRSIVENEQISIRTLSSQPVPEWLRNIQLEAREKGLDRLTAEEIDGEIAAVRRNRRERRLHPGE